MAARILRLLFDATVWLLGWAARLLGLALAVALSPLLGLSLGVPCLARRCLQAGCGWLRMGRGRSKGERVGGFVVPTLAPIVEWLVLVSAGYWIGQKAPQMVAKVCGDRRTRDEFPITWNRREARWTDGYVLAAAFLGMGLLAVLPFFHWVLGERWFRPLMCTIAGYRLAEIFAYAVWAHVFERVQRGPSQPRLASAERFLLLNVINYGEIVVLFAILWALMGRGIDGAWGALERSIRIATMVGFSNPPLDEHWVDRVLFVSETAMALMFILFVLARAVSVIPRRQ